ncbi:hypothetical protein [Paraflavitalea speifideaquila]|uniref:hypothetical protein n=1 Tax=Paraflavitalea speifideaquila TaxID=3076558 RepID=UPI0028EEB70E|nr:hypothetical protein [Paraflavitalea speifideiaquila]
MRTNLPERKLHGYTMPLLVIGMLLSTVSSSALPAFSSTMKEQPADTILVQKQVNTKKHKIKLYPNATHQVLFSALMGRMARSINCSYLTWKAN